MLLGVVATEAVLSAFLTMSLVAHLLWPDTARSAVGVASVISYEGRLTDASGNPLGGTGQPYCFRFSIYDAETAGTKLWPAGTPGTTKATTTDGVFSALIGVADALTYNFYDSDTTYLNVDVNTTIDTCAGTWESLSPRQRIAATGYAFASQNVYSSLLRTDNSNNRVQVGTGTGGASPKFLGLDVQNTSQSVGATCTTSGTVWYNSAVTQALICENGFIRAVGNATTTVATTVNAVSPGATSGTVVFSNSNGVTFGINGNTITASVAAGGGGGATISAWPTSPNEIYGWVNTATLHSGASAGTGGSTQWTASARLMPINLPAQLNIDRIEMIMSPSATSAGTGSATIGQLLGFYTLNANTALSLVSSFVWTMAMSQNSITARSHRFGWGSNSAANSTSYGGNSSASFSGLRMVQFLESSASMPAGQYYLAHILTQRTSSVNVYRIASIPIFSASQTSLASNLGRSNLSGRPGDWRGIFSTTSNGSAISNLAMPASIHTSVITQTGGTSQWLRPFVSMLRRVT